MDQFEPIKELGRGAFGKVFLMRQKVLRELMCVKVIKVKNIPKKEREACRMEVLLLKRLNHPNIVGYKESFLTDDRNNLCIVMQYADGGDLAEQIKLAARQRKLFSESKILHWFVQMALGLHYMHSNRVLHRDLKSQNIFLLGNGRLVLGDLGISKVLDGTLDFAQTCIGTPYYMSPEIFKNKPYNHKSDIWALGCVLYEMTTLNHAFDANSLNGLACKIIKGRYPPIASRYSTSLRELISAMLSTTPASRPHLETILQRPFVKRHIRDFLTDLMSRSAPGTGTIAVRDALTPDGGLTPNNDDYGGSPEVSALKEQLQTLQMDDILTAACRNKIASSEKTNTPSTAQAQRAARDHASALRREEERKRSVEAALEKLKRERQQRLQDHERFKADAQRYARLQRRPPTAAGSQNTNNSKRPVSRRSVASAPEQPKSQNKLAREKSPIPRQAGGGQDNNALRPQKQPSNRPSTSAADNSEARAVADLDKWVQRLPGRRVTPTPNVRAATPKQDIQPPIKQEKLSVKAANDLARAEALRKARRDTEKQRRGEIFEKLRRDKLALDQQLAKLRHLRESQPRRPPSANKQGGGIIVFGDNPPPPPLFTPKDPKANAEEKTIQNKEVPLPPPSKVNEIPTSLSRIIEESEPCRPPLPPELPTSARDRVLRQRAQAQAEKETERLRQLSHARAETSQQRQRAKVQADSQYRSSFDGSPMADAHRIMPTTPPENNIPSQRNDLKISEIEPVKQEQQKLSPKIQDNEETSSYAEDIFENQSEDEFDRLGCAVPEPGAVDQADEDLHQREEQLKVELEYTKTRCEELRKSLEHVKSYIPQEDKAPRRKQWEAPANNPADNFCLYEEEYDDFETTGASEESPVPPPEEAPPVIPEEINIVIVEKPAINCIEKEKEVPPTNGVEKQVPSKSPTKTPPRTPTPIKQTSSTNSTPRTPSAANKIADRIQILRRRCIETLGQQPFQAAYDHLRYLQEAEDIDADSVLELGNDACNNIQEKEQKAQAKLIEILGRNVRFAALVDQLIFMEDTILL